MAASGDKIDVTLTFERPLTERKLRDRCLEIAEECDVDEPAAVTPDDGPAGFRWRGVDGIVRKLIFESAGDGHDRVTYRWNGCKWLLEGREPVTEVALEGGMPMTNADVGP